MKINSKLLLILLVCIVVIVCASVYYIMNNYISIISKEEVKSYTIKEMSSDTLRVGIIGDSWADMQGKYNKILDSMLTIGLENHIPVEIYSSGKGGAKSKLVYTNMYEEKDIHPTTYEGIKSSKFVLLQHPQYCIVFAGINDAVCKMGEDFYVGHMMLIIDQLLKFKIVPVIIEIPSVDLDRAYENNKKNKLLRHLTMWLTNSEFYCIDDYRNALVDEIKKRKLGKNIVYISTETLSSQNGFMGKDGIHPTEFGFIKLDSLISYSIIKNIRTNTVVKN